MTRKAAEQYAQRVSVFTEVKTSMLGVRAKEAGDEEWGGHKQMKKFRTVPDKVSKVPIFGEIAVGGRRRLSSFKLMYFSVV